MQIILLERVAKLGQMGEVVNVKDGYARNFLLPQGKGLRVNAANLARFEAEKAALETRNAETRATAQAEADKIDGATFVIIRSASDAGSLYGSVTPRDVADAAAENDFKIDRNQVVLQGPIKDLGLHDVRSSTIKPKSSAFTSSACNVNGCDVASPHISIACISVMRFLSISGQTPN